MNCTALIDSSSQPTTTAACHQDHQHWQQIIRQQEEEIRQLRALLLDVMNHYNCRSLRYDAVDYYRDLNQLQAKLDRLNRDLICERADCSVAQEKLPCADTRFGLSATIERHATSLANEFTRIKDGCLQFLAGRVNEKENQLLGMAYSSLRRRVADALLRLQEPLPSGEPAPPIQLSRDDLAAVIGTATESLIRTLSEFKHDGLIEITGAGIRVVQPDKLRRANW